LCDGHHINRSHGAAHWRSKNFGRRFRV
jgi:hypothetical protein